MTVELAGNTVLVKLETDPVKAVKRGSKQWSSIHCCPHQN
jgi:hypothetical protein